MSNNRYHNCLEKCPRRIEKMGGLPNGEKQSHNKLIPSEERVERITDLRSREKKRIRKKKKITLYLPKES